MRAIFISTCAVVAVVGAYYGQPLMKDNSDAITIIVTVITIFAGFLVAIIAILGDPAFTPRGSWRIASDRHDRIEASIIRHTYLFYIYLITISLLFAGVLIRKAPDSSVGPQIKIFVERSYLFFGIFSFLLTLWLPLALGKIQLSRSAAEIEMRREEEGIKPQRKL